MKHLLVLAATLCAVLPAASAADAKVLAAGLTNPESVAVTPDGKIYVSVIGEFDKPGDGAIVRIENGKAVPFVNGLDDPKGLVVYQQWLFVTDRDKVLRIDATGKTDVVAGPDAFPTKPQFLNDITADPESGNTPTLYVSDSGDLNGNGGAVYRITLPNPKAKTGAAKVSLIADATIIPGLHTPNGLTLDGRNFLLIADFGTGKLYRLRMSDNMVETVADGFGGADGLAWDYFGRLFVSDWKNGKLFAIPQAGQKPILLPVTFQAAADICVDHENQQILVPDMKAGTLTAVPINIPGWEVDDSPLPLQAVPAFTELKFTGWTPETPDGKPYIFRPIVLTHAGDGSNRIFLADQYGVIHVFPNDPKATATKVFLDIRDKVQYDDRTNEEGLLGMAFHPRYKETGEFFVFYTPKGQQGNKRENVVVRFKVRKDDPDAADPTSEEEVYRFTDRPFWNHDGGTICFGPDGYLYITHGDGGSANDPFDNGQDLKTPLGAILRVDIDRQENGKNYAIPKDNPFVGRPDALPEIYAYGLRNVWRMAFDRKTGRLWAADVGQNLYEEINLIDKGGNYGWNRRESFHPFGEKGVGVRPEYIDPIWEYHHDVGKSITGGTVYRGTKLPELDGWYLYGDYVSTKIWALRYDEVKKRVVANRPIRDPGRPILSFGEDEQGEVYLLTTTPSGREGIFTFAK
jgi:glucose/arabinose dehydrogenase